MHQDLVELVDMALLDGDLSDKQREIITRKAEKLGEDLDEFEIWLEGKVAIAKRKQPQAFQTKQQSASVQTKNDFEVKKCPQCKAEIQSMVSKCPYCGYEIRTDESNASVTALFQKLEEIDSKEDRKGGLSGITGHFGDMLGGSGSRDGKKVQAITTFPVPNTKESILEFIALAIPNCKGHKSWASNTPQIKLAKAWASKLEQVLIKGKMMFKDDKQSLNEVLQFEEQFKKIK